MDDKKATENINRFINLKAWGEAIRNLAPDDEATHDKRARKIINWHLKNKTFFRSMNK